MTHKTPKEIAQEFTERDDFGSIRDRIAAAIEADRAQRDFSNPLPFQETEGGVFTNESGDKLIEPIGDETGELILVRKDGTMATLRGEWSTGYDA